MTRQVGEKQKFIYLTFDLTSMHRKYWYTRIKTFKIFRGTTVVAPRLMTTDSHAEDADAMERILARPRAYSN